MIEEVTSLRMIELHVADGILETSYVFKKISQQKK
jgi:hypothetical protein